MSVTLVLLTDDTKDSLMEMVECLGLEAGVDPYAGQGDEIYWLIKADDAVVGFTCAHSINWVSRRCRGSLWITPGNRHNGYGREALEQRNRLLFDRYNMNRIEWAVATDNVPMQAVANAMKQMPEGVARQVAFYDGQYHDYVLYALLREDRVKEA